MRTRRALLLSLDTLQHARVPERGAVLRCTSLLHRPQQLVPGARLDGLDIAPCERARGVRRHKARAAAVGSKRPEDVLDVAQEERDPRLAKHALGVGAASLPHEVGPPPQRIAHYAPSRRVLVALERVPPAEVAALARRERGEGQARLADLAVAAAVQVGHEREPCCKRAGLWLGPGGALPACLGPGVADHLGVHVGREAGL